MKRFFAFFDRFFFEEVSASGFGLMRIAWAAVAIIFMLGSAPDIVRYYSGVGILPSTLPEFIAQGPYRFTVLSSITEPLPVVLLWVTMLWCMLCTMLGVRTRLMTILSFLLLCSFQQRNTSILSSGDGLMRLLGFLLVIAPTIDAFSIDRLQQSTRKPPTMPVWPYRLLLWQFIVLYIASFTDKLRGELWLNGTAVATVFHHPAFFRYSKTIADVLTVFSLPLSWSFLLFELSWILLLVPQSALDRLPKCLSAFPLKRVILLAGIVFHGGIFFFMDVGLFSFAIFTGYLGLLLTKDFDALNTFFNARWKIKHAEFPEKI